MIKKFNDFISEKYFPTQNDSPDIISYMNTFNNSELVIVEYNKKKVTLTNIYLTYKDEIDLYNKLSTQEFIEKTSDKKSINFKNPLLGLWAQSCKKNRELQDITNQLNKWQEEIKSEESNIISNPSMEVSSKEQISLLEEKIKLKNKEISNKKIEILNLEKLAKTKLDEIKKELADSKKRIDMYQSGKNS